MAMMPVRTTHRPSAATLVAIVLAALGLLLPALVRAQEQAPPEVKVTIKPATTQVAPGSILPIAVVFDHQPGWHIHTQNPKPPPGIPPGVLIPTSITINAPEGVEVSQVQWPATKSVMVDLSGSGRPVPYDVFGGRAIALISVRIPAGAPVGSTIALPITVGYQACDDRTCLPPETLEQTITLTVSASPPPPSPDPDFADMLPPVFAGGSEDAGAGSTAGSAAGSSFFGFSLSGLSGPMGFLVLALLGAVGGFILNLTPCVLPVIPIKVLTLTQSASSPRRALILGLWMSLGVIAFWLGLGIPAALVSAWADPSRIFGIWWVTFGIGVLIAAMGVGIMGLFTLNLPQSVYMVNPKAESPGGSFLFGVMTAVLGLPCFGFVAGALLPAAAAIGPASTITVFGAMGVGMALPYAILAANPGWIKRVPRTGPASELVKQVMGLLLLAAAAYFIGSGLIALVNDHPHLGKVLHWWAIAGFGAAAGVWLIVRTWQITPRAARRGIFTAVGVILAAGAIWPATAFTREARQDRVWQAYSEAAVQAALASGKVVVMDFTAQWCLNCQALKAAVLNVDPVRPELERPDVALFEVDLTSTKAPGWEKLRALGQRGIPLLVVQGPGLSEPWMSNAYTPEQVLEALRRARGAAGGPGGGSGGRAAR